MSASILSDPRLYVILLQIDLDLAAATRKSGCPFCGGRLDSARYRRKPRAPLALGPEHGWRESFCCAVEGCRRRTTPPSARFLGRRVYLATVVVLTTALAQGLSASRVKRLRAELEVDRTTLRRWQRWWRETFVHTPFWQTARARFMPPVLETDLPRSLVERFSAGTVDGLMALLFFFASSSGSPSALFEGR
jgi:hypothetical protein